MRVAVCLPSHGGAYREHEKCLSELRRARPHFAFLELSGMPCIDIGRSSISESALRHFRQEPGGGLNDNDLLLWLDADMVFTVETCDQILEEARKRQAVVGCLYAGKKFGAKPQVAFKPSEREYVAFEGGSLLEVEAIGFGCVAMPAIMLEVVAEKLRLPRLGILEQTFRPWFTTDSSGQWETMHSDDYSFCRRARDAGFRIFADTRQRVGHIGQHVYQLEDAIPLTRGASVKFTIDPSITENKKDAAE